MQANAAESEFRGIPVGAGGGWISYPPGFARFEAGPWGRAIDTVLGIALVWWGIGFGSVFQDVATAIGLFALTAGLFNTCWLAPLVGFPFRGRDVRSS
ncbi:MAG: DUF2892 domain-containing protein [Krumholzibacteria bacterium]|nr:DUF2892 domain-containing protein [Candidatus Krumholzibacteria bacterium]